MIIASQKRKENIAEYLLYMWQIEDIIRANGLDLDKIKANVIDRHTELTDEQRRQMEEWYESLIDMMRREVQLVQLHDALLKDPRFGEYTKRFYASLPFIVELRSKAGDDPKGEIETCFNALYGMLMLRLRGAEVTPDTQAAVSQISQFIALLSHYFHLDEKEELFKNED